MSEILIRLRLCFSLCALNFIEIRPPHKKDEGKIKFVGNARHQKLTFGEECL